MNRAALAGLSRAMKLPISIRSRSALSVKRSCAIAHLVGNRVFNLAKTCRPSLTRPAARSSSPACRSRCNAASFSASLSAGSTVTENRASAAGGSGKRSRIRLGSSEAETSTVNGSEVFAVSEATGCFHVPGEHISTRPSPHAKPVSCTRGSLRVFSRWQFGGALSPNLAPNLAGVTAATSACWRLIPRRWRILRQRARRSSTSAAAMR
jgi:hypothetical protein